MSAERNEHATEQNVSISDVARNEFNKPVLQMWNVTTPVLVKDLSLRKEITKQRCCTYPLGGRQGALQTIPNFASALLGRTLAALLGLNGPSLPENPSSQTDTFTDHDDHVFRNVSAVIVPGEVTLLLGPSSSGKTTLLRTICDKINGRIPPDQSTVEGSLKLGSIDPSESHQDLTRATAFVDQSDATLTPVLTVEETVRFANACAEGTSETLDEVIEAMFRLAGLNHVKSTVVGDAELRGVSGGQKRRVKLLEMAVGSQVQLVALDEITNGLDAASALTICKVVRTAVEVYGIAGIAALLQPSTEVFYTFHQLILLTPQGEVAYSGTIERALPHFESFGLVKPSDMNEAEFLLQCASSPSDFWDSSGGEIPSYSLSSSHLADSFRSSPAGRDLVKEIDRLESDGKREERATRDNEGLECSADFALSTHRQILLLMGHSSKLVMRNPASLQRVVASIVFGAFIGTLFLNTSSDARGTSIWAGYGTSVRKA